MSNVLFNLHRQGQFRFVAIQQSVRSEYLIVLQERKEIVVPQAGCRRAASRRVQSVGVTSGNPAE